MNYDWYLWALEFRWPHQGLILGFESWDSTDEHPYLTFKIHFLCISIVYEAGYGEDPYQ